MKEWLELGNSLIVGQRSSNKIWTIKVLHFHAHLYIFISQIESLKNVSYGIKVDWKEQMIKVNTML